ncbi:MAG TPA: hypothetical protein VK550_12330 [Polyangiaceae bacterium]|nr:hypothetical protein [Polyangiaceae bacterium]
MSFVGTIQRLTARVGPWFLHSRNIGRFMQAFAVVYDNAITALQQGLALAHPLRSDPSAFPVLSVDRTIRLYPSEPESSKRERLANWLQIHRRRGTHLGELLHSQPYFAPEHPVMRIVHQDGAGASATWWSIAADGSLSEYKAVPSNWDYDGQTYKWSRFWVILYMPPSFALARYDDGTLYDGGAVYDGISGQIAHDIAAMILESKAGHSRLQAYILATDPASFDPTSTAVVNPDGSTTLPVGNWGTSMSGPPDSVYTRLRTAVWIYERAMGE